MIEITFNKPATYSGVKRISVKNYSGAYHIQQISKGSKEWCVVHEVMGYSSVHGLGPSRKTERETVFRGDLRSAKKWLSEYITTNKSSKVSEVF